MPPVPPENPIRVEFAESQSVIVRPFAVSRHIEAGVWTALRGEPARNRAESIRRADVWRGQSESRTNGNLFRRLGDTDDAGRRPVGSQSPSRDGVVQLLVEWARCDQATDAFVICGNTQSTIEEFFGDVAR